MPKISRKVIIIIACAAVLVIAGVLIAILTANNPENVDEYKIGNDTFQSINAVVGHREVTSVSARTENGVTTKTYKYAAEGTAFQDLEAYVIYLRSDGGFSLISDRTIDGTTSRMDLGKDSEEDGKMIIITIEYSSSGYAIEIQKRVGTMRIY